MSERTENDLVKTFKVVRETPCQEKDRITQETPCQEKERITQVVKGPVHYNPGLETIIRPPVLTSTGVSDFPCTIPSRDTGVGLE